MFTHFFSCDSFIFIKNYDQNSLNNKLHVNLFVKSEWLCLILKNLCIQTIVFNFELKLHKILKYTLIIMHMFNR